MAEAGWRKVWNPIRDDRSREPKRLLFGSRWKFVLATCSVLFASAMPIANSASAQQLEPFVPPPNSLSAPGKVLSQ